MTGVIFMETAKIFMSGRSQAVRLPKSCRFQDQTEVCVSRIGDTVLLTPKNSRMQSLMAGIRLMGEDFLPEGREEVTVPDHRAEL